MKKSDVKTPVVKQKKKVVNKVVKSKSVKPTLQNNTPICKKCVEVHKRDTKDPVKCPYCNEIIGCFWHPSGFHKHLTECKKKHKSAKSSKNDPVESSVTAPNVVTGYKHPGGRPPKYKTVPELENLIEAYFQSCWKQKLDMFGNPIWVKDKKGKKTDVPVMYQYKPYTVAGLAVALGMVRQTLINYEKKDKFLDTIKRAKQMCEAYAEESLFVGKNPTGAIFNLKNNYGWKDKTETEHSGSLIWREEPPK